MTLWNLPAETEDQFDSHWEQWIDRREEWEPFFEAVAAIEQATDVRKVLRHFDLFDAGR